MATYNLIIIRPDATVISAETCKCGFTPSYWEKEKKTLMKRNDILTYRSRNINGRSVVTEVSILCIERYVEVLILDSKSIK